MKARRHYWYRRKTWLMLSMVAVVLFVCFRPKSEMVNKQSIQQVHPGMTLTEVSAHLGQPIDARMSSEGMMCWSMPLAANSSMVFWCLPGTMVYCVEHPNSKGGYGWMKWASSTHYVSIHFQDGRVVEVWHAPAGIDVTFSGTLADRWQRWWNDLKSRF